MNTCEFSVSLGEKTAYCKFDRCTFLVSVDMLEGCLLGNSGGAAVVVVANLWPLQDR